MSIDLNNLLDNDELNSDQESHLQSLVTCEFELINDKYYLVINKHYSGERIRYAMAGNVLDSVGYKGIMDYLITQKLKYHVKDSKVTDEIKRLLETFPSLGLERKYSNILIDRGICRVPSFLTLKNQDLYKIIIILKDYGCFNTL